MSPSCSCLFQGVRTDHKHLNEWLHGMPVQIKLHVLAWQTQMVGQHLGAYSVIRPFLETLDYLRATKQSQPEMAEATE